MATERPGTLIGTGRNADVYDVGGGRVLRRYRDGRDPAAVEREGQVMTHARAHGVPVPEVFEVSGSDIVMERATGPTMLDVLGRRPWTLRRQARLLARLHATVHRTPPPPGIRALHDDDGADGQVLLHRDLHPDNVILTSAGPVIIDWEGAARGPAMYDVAWTWAILASSEVPESGPATVVVRTLQAQFTRSFVRAAGPIDELSRARAVRDRIVDHNVLPAERARLERLPH
ncbi:MAG TPA: aminoglycoside phosphotransferase family protein [Trebonia sp.]|jgi:Ser/Thr protein kinase RdoA (MazF antagonist)|nr:aminoglycoside phosphotransferase family protein [Trebonia sp.]